jgi:hypothetical protein
MPLKTVVSSQLISVKIKFKVVLNIWSDGQFIWCQAIIWILFLSFYFYTVASFLLRNTLSDEKTDLQFTVAAGTDTEFYSKCFPLIISSH